jgi:hypothetical protein
VSTGVYVADRIAVGIQVFVETSWIRVRGKIAATIHLREIKPARVTGAVAVHVQAADPVIDCVAAKQNHRRSRCRCEVQRIAEGGVGISYGNSVRRGCGCVHECNRAAVAIN